MLYNFPDAHFFLYFRGGDGRGESKRVQNGVPGAVGGVTALYP